MPDRGEPALGGVKLRGDHGHDVGIQRDVRAQDQQLRTQHGLDAEEILGGLPTWEHDYRPVRLGYRGRPTSKIADEVPLSIHGMAHVRSAVLPVQRRFDAFLAALKTATIMQRGIKPQPTQPVELKVPGDDFTRTVNIAAGTALSADQIHAGVGHWEAAGAGDVVVRVRVGLAEGAFAAHLANPFI